MRAIAGLLLLLISLLGSQAQNGSELPNVQAEVKVLKELFVDLLLKQAAMESEVGNLKTELALGTQNRRSWLSAQMLVGF